MYDDMNCKITFFNRNISIARDKEQQNSAGLITGKIKKTM
jgi:hypothetical protein